MSDIIAIVSKADGKGTITDTHGVTRPVEVGEYLYAGDIIRTESSAVAELELGNNELLQLLGGQVLEITPSMQSVPDADTTENQIAPDSVDDILALLEGEGDLLEQLEATAAGTDAGPSGEGSNFVRLVRIVENIDPINFNLTSFVDPSVFIEEFGGDEATNHAPEIITENSVIAGTVIEAGQLRDGTNTPGIAVVTGQLTAVDIDFGAVLTWSIEGVNSDTYGSFTLDPVTGAWRYELDNDKATTQSLKDGESVTQQYVVRVTDQFGASTEQIVTITIQGTNDAPVITNDSTQIIGTVTEAGHLDDGTPVAGTAVATGQLSASDVDADAVLAWSVQGTQSDTYGTFTLDPVSGQWRFELDNSKAATQALKEGQSVTQQYVVRVTDEFGAYAEQTVTVTINGTNDVPVITNSAAAATGTVTEAGHLDDGTPVAGTAVATGQLSATDVDADAVLAWSVQGTNSTTYGTFTLDPVSGQWRFELDNSKAATQALKEGQSVTQQYVVRVTDEFGAYAEQTVTVTINGTNDVPVITNDSTQIIGNVTEAGHLDDGTPVAGTAVATGQLSATDVDADAVLAWSVQGTNSTTYGTFTLDPVSGQWRFELDNSKAATQALKEGQSVTQQYVVRVTDEFGAYAEQTVTVTINGTNDVPVITNSAAAATGTVTEAGHLDDGTPVAGTAVATGQLSASDVDADAVLAWSVQGANSTTYGAFTLDPVSGEWRFELDNSKAATQALKEGQSVTQQYVVRVTDEFGAYAEQTVTVTINGTNDVPVITNDSTQIIGNVTEAGHLDDGTPVAGTAVATGQLSATDVDADAVLAWSVQGTNSTTYGTFTLDPVSGQWRFELDNSKAATQALKEGQSVTQQYVVRVTDEFGAYAEQTVTVTINGTNDVPVITNDSTQIIGNVTEAGHLDDGTPVAGTAVATGQLSATDVDADAVLAWSVQGTNSTTYGAFTLDPVSGQWRFELDNSKAATQALKEGQSVTQQYVVRVTDEFGAYAEQTVTVTINGTNDVPVITNSAAAATGTVTEAGHLDDGTPVAGTAVATGQLSATDVDADAVLAWSVQGTNSTTYGAFTLDPVSGEWRFELDNSKAATQALKEGQSVTQQYVVRVTDEFGAYAEQTVTVTINGTNDVPVITNSAAAATGTVTEAGHLDDGTPVAGTAVATGQLSATDVDADAVLAWSVQGTNSTTYGAFTLDPVSGEWRFELDNSKAATQALKEGQSVTQQYVVRVTDEFGAYAEQTVTVTINGTNDVPVITNSAAAATGTVTEAGHLDNGTPVAGTAVATGQLSASDVDADAVLAWSVQGTNSTTYGAFTLDPVSGEWRFELDNSKAATQALKEGQSVTQQYVVRVTDEFGAYAEQTVTVTINGTNDVPVITNSAAAATGTVTEAGHLDDGTPVAGTAVATGQLSATDVDADAVLAWSVQGTQSDTYGTFTLDPVSGQWRFELDNSKAATQALKEGQSVTQQYVVRVTDEFGAYAEQTVTVTINGTNDVPVITNDATQTVGSVTEAGHLDDGTPVDGTPVATGQLTASDVDADAVLSWNVQGANSATYGNFTVDKTTGKWRFELDNSKAATQALKEGETVTQQYVVRVTDEFGAYAEQTVTVTIHGTNDAPIAVADRASVREDGALTAGTGTNNNTSIVRGNVLSNDTDVDHGDTKEVIGVSSGSHSSASGNVGTVINGLYGSVTINADGTYTYNLDNSKPQVQALANNQTVSDVFTYTMKDAAGATSSTTLTITVRGTNDAPVISLATGDKDSAALTETTSAQGDTGLQASGKLTLTDVDTRDIVTTSVLSVAKAGSYSGALPSDSALKQMLQVSGVLNNTQQTDKINWDFNSGAENFNFLPEGATLVLTYTIQARDNSGTSTSGSNLQTITITITGTDDLGSIGSVTHSIKEDHSISGNLFNEAGQQDPDSGEYLSVTGFTVEGMSGTFSPDSTVDIVLGGSSNVIGSLTLNADGSYTFTPAENYSGAVPQITYYANSGNKAIGSATLNLTVTPVSDAPDLGNVGNKVVTPEDTAIALGLKAPLVTDNIDKNGTADGDNPELLGLISLAGIPAGVQLQYGADTFTSNGRPITIKLTDVSNQISTLGPYDIAMTTAQFEALKVLPNTDSHVNFNVTMKVTSYEVDNAGKPLSGIPGATATKVVTVDVHAVTDGADSFTLTTPAAGFAVNEDQTLDLRTALGQSFTDKDGSEKLWYTVEGLPQGTTVYINGRAYTANTADGNGTFKISSVNHKISVTSDNTPQFSIKPPANFSGNISDIKITLHVQDTDSDSPDATPAVLTKEVVIGNIYVAPVAGDVTIATPATGLEDTAAFLFKQQNGSSIFRLTDTDGSEFITAVGINKAQLDALQQQGAEFSFDLATLPTMTVGGKEYYLFDLDTYQNQTITPPPQSSVDIDLEYLVQTTDTNGIETSVANTTSSKTLVVKAVSEVLVSGADWNTGHDYGDLGLEDAGWLALNTTDFALYANNPDNVDGVKAEETFAYLSLSSQNTDLSALAGSVLQYFDGSQYHQIILTSAGTIAKIPAAYLDTVSFKAPDHFSGKVILDMKVHTQDYDDNTGEAVTPWTSNAVQLSFNIVAVADDVTLQIKQGHGLEDSGRDAAGNLTGGGIPLSIKIASDDTDGSETYTVVIENIPQGSSLSYNGVVIYTDGDTSGRVEISNFDNNAPLLIIPPHNSNNDFTLKVSGYSVEQSNGDTSTLSAQLDLKVQLRGVADPVLNTGLATETATDDLGAVQQFNQVLTETELAGQPLVLNSVFSTPQDIRSYDTDGSEKVTVMVTGIPEGFTLHNATFMGGSGEGRKWSMTLEQFQQVGNGAVVISSDNPDFSGELAFNVRFISTENDGNSRTGDVHKVSLLVTPVAEAAIQLTTTSKEDTLTKLNFGLTQGDADNSESLQYVWINISDLSDPAFTLYVGGNTVVLDASVPGVTVDGDYLKLDSSVFSQLYVQFADQLGDVTAQLDVQYQVTDSVTVNGHTYTDVKGPVSVVYQLVNQAVTDEISQQLLQLDGDTASVTVNGSDITVNQVTRFTADLQVISPDKDGSEKLVKIVIEGVPQGVSIDGGTYMGHVVGDSGIRSSGVWIVELDPNDPRLVMDADGAHYQLTFSVDGKPAEGSHQLTITAYNRDGSAAMTKDSSEFTLTITDDFKESPGIPNPVPEIVALETIPFDVTEDVPFTLADVVRVETVGGASSFSITLQYLENASVQGAELLIVDGKPVYIINGYGDQADIEAALAAVTIIPDADFNQNRGEPLSLNLTLTTYHNGADLNAGGTEISKNVIPVTDSLHLSESFSYLDEQGNPSTQPLEDGQYQVSINIDSVDAPYYQLVNADGSPVSQLVLNHSGVAGTLSWNGGSVDLSAANSQAVVPFDQIGNLTFTPLANAHGTAQFNYVIYAQEQGAANISGSVGHFSFNIQPVADGLELNGAQAAGLEDQLIEIKVGEYSLSDQALLIDTDGSEQILTLLIDNVPDGFLVFFGDAGTTLALNSGDNGNGTNTWTIPVSSGAPKVWLKAPENWSGQVDGLNIVTIVKDGNSVTELQQGFSANWEAVADAITLNPTKTFGNESGDISIKLNANMVDIDGSETVTLTLASQGGTSLPDGIIFSAAGQTITAVYDIQTGVYTLTGITVDQINELVMTPPPGMIGHFTIAVSAVTVDGNSTLATPVTGQFDLSLKSVASGVTSFTAQPGSELGSQLSGSNVVGAGYSVSLIVDGLDLLDKSGTETLTLKLSGLGDSLTVEVSSLPGVTATKASNGDWLIELGSPAGADYQANLQALQNGGLKLVSTGVSGEVAQIEVSAYSTVTDTKEQSTVLTKPVSLNLTVDTVGALNGTDADDIITGTDGDDLIIGGAGDDIMSGGLGADTFAWYLGDQGSVTTPATDTILDFSTDEGDVLDLRDLVQSGTSDNITDYLSLSKEGNDTVLSVQHESQGGVTQKIVLKDVDFSGFGSTETEILNNLISQGNIRIDN